MIMNCTGRGLNFVDIDLVCYAIMQLFVL